MVSPLILAFSLLTCAAPGAIDLQYVGPQGADGWAVRFRFTRTPLKGSDLKHGYTLRGVTTSGKQTLTLEATFGPGDELRTSRVTLRQDGQEKVATVAVENGRARVTRPGQAAQEFDVPAGVIVTSAPDWSDIALLCERYDRAKGGKQALTALWIHPSQPAQRLELTIECQGRFALREGKLDLTVFLIHLRNQNAYRAWAKEGGTLVRLAPLAAKGRRAGLFLKGYEDDKAWRDTSE
jgi:hypothetical protein